MRISFEPGRLSPRQLGLAWRQPVEVALPPNAIERVERNRGVIESILAQGQTVYGVNTGFGRLAQQRIDPADLRQLQVNLILSHAAGIGPELDERVVRLILLLKINALALGCSGIRPTILDYLRRFLAADLLPCIPSQGSVGASGDLAPLAHLAAALLGIGLVRAGDETLSAEEALERVGLPPLVLEAKEGLALVNGTQASTALAWGALLQAWEVFQAALVAGAMTLDACLGTDAAFDPRIHALRGHPGQIDCAAVYRRLLRGSAIRASARAV